MQCPQDQTVLQMTDRQGIEIDYCPTCRGVWLDRGELDKIIERSSASAPPSAAGQYGYGAPQGTAYPPAPGYSSYPGSPDSPKSPDSPDDYYRHRNDPRYANDPRYRKKRKHSFLGDLFDF